MYSTCGYEDIWTGLFLACVWLLHESRGMWNVGQWKAGRVQTRAGSVHQCVIHFHIFCMSHLFPKEASYITEHGKAMCTVMLGVHPFSSSLPRYLHSVFDCSKSHLPTTKTPLCTHTHTHTQSMQPPNQKPRKRLAQPYKGCCSLHQEGRER